MRNKLIALPDESSEERVSEGEFRKRAQPERQGVQKGERQAKKRTSWTKYAAYFNQEAACRERLGSAKLTRKRVRES